MRKTRNGVIYIITNEVLPNHLKVGYTDDVDQTIQQMNKGSKVKGAYNVFATYETKAAVTAKQLYNLLGSVNGEVSTVKTQTGRNITIDYLMMKPEEAYNRLFIMAKLSGTMDMLHKENVSDSVSAPVLQEEKAKKGRKRTKQSETVSVSKTTKVAASKGKAEKAGEEVQSRTRRPNLKFSQYNIPIGSVLEYVKDKSKKVKVVGEHMIEYNGDKMSVSECAKRLLNSKSGVQGTNYFSYNGKTLSEIRNELGL